MSVRNGDQDVKKLLMDAIVELEKARSRAAALEAERNEPIAIVGMGCRFPGGCDTPEAYWSLLSEGRDSLSTLPPGRWNPERFYDPDPDAKGKSYTRHGSYLGAVDGFDRHLFRINASEAEQMDPQHRLLLEVAWEALEDAGTPPARLRNASTGVFIGLMNQDYTQLALGDINMHTGAGICLGVAAGRLAHNFGFRGPALALDTTCSSSLVAVHLACQSLRRRECRSALAGGVNLILSPHADLILCSAKMLAPDGRCKTFDASGDGYGRGEGCGLVYLKRLSDAEADGDRVLAVLRGTAINHDGPSSALPVPNGRAQEQVLQDALKDAGVSPDSVGYVESHGTGTSLGDPIEIEALNAVYGPGRDRERALLVGSVKTNIGHLESAAGIASLIKAVLILRKGVIPPHLNLRNPNPHIPWKEIPIQVPTAATPFPDAGAPRRIGVSSFGFSGTNAHVILEAAGPRKAGAAKPGCGRVLALSALNETSLRALAAKWVAALDADPAADWADACYTAASGRNHFARRAALVAASAGEARSKLAALAAGGAADGLWEGKGGEAPPKAAFRFPDAPLSAPAVRSGKPEAPAFRAALDECARLFASSLDRSLDSLLWGDDAGLLKDPRYGIPAAFALGYASAQAWKSWGIAPAAVIGEGAGRWAAAVIAGSLSLAEAAARLSAGMPFAAAGKTEIPVLASAHEALAAGCDSILAAPAPGAGEAALCEGLAIHYARGGNPDWEAVFRDAGAAKIALPTYAFDRHPYWVKERAGVTPLLPKDGPSVPEGFLGRRLPLAGGSRHYESMLGGPSQAWIGDHRVKGKVVMPGAAYAEIALEAARDLFPGEAWAAEGLAFHRPMVLDGNVSAQTVVKGEGDRRSIEIWARPEGREDWTLFASGSIRRAGREPAAAGTAEARAGLAAGSGGAEIARLYAGMAERGLQYGPAFRAVTALERHGEAVHARLALPPAAGAPARGLIFHPILLDAAFQIASAVVGDAVAGDAVFLPAAIGSLRVEKALPASVEVKAERLPSSDPDSLLLRYRFTDAEGGLLAALEGLELRRVPGDPIRDEAERLMYHPAWKETEPAKAAAPAREWLILGEGRSAGMLARAFAGASVACKEGLPIAGPSLAPAARGWREGRKGEAARRPSAIVLCLEPESPEAEADPLPRMEALLGAVKDLILEATSWTEPGEAPFFAIVTRGALGCEAGGALSQAALAGLWKSAAQEFPAWDFAQFDMPSAADARQWEGLARLLAAGTGPMASLRLREGKWETERLQPGPGPRADKRIAIDPEGAYLITGGTRGLGLATAQWLAAQGARRLVLAGRSAPEGAEARGIEGLRAAGVEVSVHLGDMARPETARELVRLARRGQASLKGVVHAAGLADDGLLAGGDAARWAKVLGPKAAGAWHLHRETREPGLDFFLMFSSLAAALGNAGQAPYAAANAFLDGLAGFRQARGLAAHSIAWGPWSGTGMAERAGVLGSMAKQGVNPIRPAAGLAAIDIAFGCSGARTVAVDADWSAFARRAPKAAALIAELAGSAAAAVPAADVASGAAPEWADLTQEEAFPLIADYLRGRVIEVTAMGESALGDSGKPFLEWDLGALGLDSLKAMELRDKVRSDTGVNLPLHALLGDRKVTDIVALLYEKTLLRKLSAAPAPALAAAAAAPADQEMETFVL